MNLQANNSLYRCLGYLLLTVLICIILYFGSTLFIPLFYGLLVAIVLYPACRWLERHRWPRSLAIAAGLSLVLLLILLLLWLFFVQVNTLRSDIPQLMPKLKPSFEQFQKWVEANLNITVATQSAWWSKTTSQLGDNSGSMLRSTLDTTISSLFVLFMVPVYAALFLYNRADMVLFLEKVIDQKYMDKLHHILHQTIITYHRFIKGMVMVYIIVGILNSIGLLLLGIDHAILFGMLTAVMTIIPYVGIIISAMIPITIAWITKDSIWYPVGVVAVFTFVQYLEANVIFPKVVGSQLNVSTLATLVAIIAGGILWGVSGMILFIPFAGILKIVSDHIEEWEPLNILLRR